jgi:hypothetical protein
MPALQASCSIPFVLRAVHDIPGAPPGAYWDGGITDYHLHLDYRTSGRAGRRRPGAVPALSAGGGARLAGQSPEMAPRRHPVPRHHPRARPRPRLGGQRLPNRKLPDRTDFTRYGNDLAARVKAWNAAAGAAQQLADEFGEWVEKPDLGRVQAVVMATVTCGEPAARRTPSARRPCAPANPRPWT